MRKKSESRIRKPEKKKKEEQEPREDVRRHRRSFPKAIIESSERNDVSSIYKSLRQLCIILCKDLKTYQNQSLISHSLNVYRF